MSGSMGVSELLLLAGLAVLIWALVEWRRGRWPLRFCSTCESVTPARTATRGSLAIEIVLWLCFILPGLLYSLWRLTTRHLVCGACGQPGVVPTDSPRARVARSARPAPDKTYTLKRESTGSLIPMDVPARRPFTFREEQHAATARQRLWIRYEDANGSRSEREIEVYAPRADNAYVFAWCCLRQEPRTFRRDQIRAWRFLPAQFDFNPLVEQYFQEEGDRSLEDKISWKRWQELRRSASRS